MRCIKKFIATILTFAMSLSMMTITPVSAANDKLTFEKNKNYSFLVEDKMTTVHPIKSGDWQTPIKADGKYVNSEDGYKVSENDIFTFEQGQGDTYYIHSEKFNSYWRSEPTSAGATGVYLTDKNENESEFSFEKSSDEKGYIKDFYGKYISLDDSNVLVRVDSIEDATEFTFVSNAVITDFSLYIEHQASGKYIRFDGTANNPVLVDGVADESGNISDDMRFEERINTNDGVINFKSKKFDLCFNSGKDGGKKVTEQIGDKQTGWESIKYQSNGDGTISFRETFGTNKLITVTNGEMVSTDLTEPTANEKFIIHTELPTEAVANVKVSDVNDTSATVTWDKLTNAIYSGFKVVATPTSVGTGKDSVTKETADNKVTLTGLTKGTEYTIKVLTVKGTAPQSASKEVNTTTKNGPRPVVKDANMKAKQDGNNIEVSWNAIKDVTNYDVYRAESAFAQYTKIGETNKTSFVDTNINSDKYKNYYKIIASNENGESDLSDEYTSLETTKFGKNMIFIAPTDNIDAINNVVQEIFKKQNNSEAAQFNSGHYAIYYKPGDYTGTACIPVGFYTHIGGLGKTPYDVKLNNIEVPAYLDYTRESAEGRDYWNDGSGTWRNATCNFWRSAENLSVVGTGEASVAEEVTDGRSLNNKKEYFNWAVAQAAPLRRVYSTRKTSYDWSYGWNSGGYTADCYFANDAGSASQQQYFTRNSVIKGDATGTLLNNFNIGVESESLPNASNATTLLTGNGFTNWNLAKSGTPGVITNITNTPESKEKPFLFLDDNGEYQIFVPSLRKNTKGISWSDTSMGEGEVVSLDKFYIAHEGDTAAKINKQLKDGKNIFFTPGQYDADEVIKVNNENTIVLGTGMATIVADNAEAAIEVADVDGVTVSGLVFDAGTKAKSKYLLKVGDKKTNTRHNDNPTLLQDLFFRVGGTTDKPTTAENALVINSNDVLNDHFWIWRADHGAGVDWENTRSDYGMIVNGDHVHMYALLDEHFNKNDVLWNGEYGATYFLQNEKCYDPISQEAWMSHDGLVNGYSAYKVSNKVKHHYAVGLGIYNVFINTGENRDSKDVQIQLDNPIEVPNAEDVIIENACTQTFAKDDGVLQKFNYIINNVGESVSSGIDKNTGIQGEGWSRKHILNYKNGVCNRGTVQNPVQENGLNPYNEEGDVDIDELIKAYEACDDKLNKSNIYTKDTFDPYKEIMDEIEPIYNNFKNDEDNGKYTPHRLTQKEVSEKAKQIKDTYAALVIADADYTKLEKAYGEANIIRKSTDYTSQFYTKSSTKDFDDAYSKAKALMDDYENNNLLKATEQDTVDNATKALNKAMDALTIAGADTTVLEKALEKANKIIKSDNYKKDKYVPVTKEFFDYCYNLGNELYKDKDKLDKRSQSLIESRASLILNGIQQLELMPASTGNLEDLIKFAENNIRDGEYFQNEYYINVAKFLDYLNKARMVIRDANINDQSEIDQTYQDLYDAINSLKLKPADYERLNALRQQALDIVAGDDYVNDRYTAVTLAFFNNEHSIAQVFSNDYMIPDQKQVDDEADKLDYAIKQLRLKDTTQPTDPVDPSNPGKDDGKKDDGKKDDQTQPSDKTDDKKDETNPSDTSSKEDNSDKNDQADNGTQTGHKSEAKSSKSQTSKKVRTGDDQQIMGYIVLAGLAVVCLAVLRKKHA